MASLYVSDLNWTPRLARSICRRHGVSLTEHGEVVRDGEVVATYELSAGTLVLHGLRQGSPLMPALQLRPAE